MSVNINLADRRNPNQTKKERAKKIRALAVALLLVTAFSAVIIFILDYRFSANYLRGQEQELRLELKPFSQVSAQLFIVNTKLEAINSILKSRKNYPEIVELVYPKDDLAIEVEEFNISERGIEIVFTAKSLNSIDEHINNLILLSEEGNINIVTLNNLVIRSDGYEADLTILL